MYSPREPDNLGLGDQPTQPLADEPGSSPFDGVSAGNQPFAQYLIAVGAMGEPNKDELARAFHDAGMQFAQAVGVEPILAVGYRSETAHPADYMDAAKVWHTYMDERHHNALREWMPKFYAALSILFGTRRLDV